VSKRFYTRQSKTWREIARPIIKRVLDEHKGEPREKIKRALRDAYPFGSRSHYPYQVWLDEIRRQLEAAYFEEKKEAQETEPGQDEDNSPGAKQLEFLAFLDQAHTTEATYD